MESKAFNDCLTFQNLSPLKEIIVMYYFIAILVDIIFKSFYSVDY